MGRPGDGASAGDGAFLYVVIGDINRRGKLQNFSSPADPDDTNVILRVEQNGTPAAGNPFTPYCNGATTLTCDEDPDCGANGPCVLEVARYYAYGIRNSFGMARDPVTGSLWMTENGPESYDEVNRVDPGLNSGWVQLLDRDARESGSTEFYGGARRGPTYSDPEFPGSRRSHHAIVFPLRAPRKPVHHLAWSATPNSRRYTRCRERGRTGFDFSG